MRSSLDNQPLVEDNDGIGHSDCREAVRNEERDAIFPVLAQAIDHRRLRDGVERGRRLVENLNGCGPEVQPAERQTLPLSTGKLAASWKQPAEHRVVALGE